MIPLAMAAIQTGIGLSQVAGGATKQNRAERAREAAIGELERTRYADYNQAYYEELQRRAQVGLPEEQRQYMEQQAERAASVGLAATEDRRAGHSACREDPFPGCWGATSARPRPVRCPCSLHRGRLRDRDAPKALSRGLHHA